MTDFQIEEYLNWLKTEKQARAKRMELEKAFKQEMSDSQIALFNSQNYKLFLLKNMSHRVNVDKLKKYYPDVYEAVTYVTSVNRIHIECDKDR